MKTIFKYLLSTLAVPALLLGTACSGSGDDPTPDEPTLTLKADKATITADGTDKATFTVRLDGADVTSQATIRCTTTGETLSGATFTATEAKTYDFVASCEGNESPKVSVTATAPAGPVESYFPRVLGMQFTSVGCTNCPALSTGIKEFEASRPDELETVSLHCDYMMADPMKISICDAYVRRFNIKGFPTFVLNMLPDSPSPVLPKLIAAEVDKLQAQGATCGIAIETSYDASTREAGIKVKITSSTAEAYRYQVFLVENGIKATQMGVDDAANYIHNNVLRAALANSVYGDKFNNGLALTPGAEATADRTRSLAEEWNSDNMRVVVAALRSEDGGNTWICANVAGVKLGESIDYKINE